MKQTFIKKVALGLLFTLASACATFAEPWKFGVMSDTQWIGADDGRSPGTVPVDIIKSLNQQFINQGVKFVVQVGDLVDQTGATLTTVQNSEDVRAAFAQELYNAGIGFFPLPGNHDSQPLAGAEFRRIYPQTMNGVMNVPVTLNPGFDTTYANLAAYPARNGSTFTVGSNFSTAGPTSCSLYPSTNCSNNSPNPGYEDWTGLSYSFDYDNVRFVLLDQFSPLNTTVNQNPVTNAIDMQQPWINSVLTSKSSKTHAFVFGHKGLITENHVDTLFGSDPSQDAVGQNAFITALYNAGARYYIQGHDHMHNRSLVSVTTGTPTDGTSAKVQDILCASDSSKFYTPGSPSNDDKYDVPAFGHKRQAQIAQELHKVGYYIFTVDGPRVTVDYYSAMLSNVAPSGCSGPNCEWLIPTTPLPLDFTKQETFGYSLNGKEFQVCQVGQTGCNSSYTQVVDTYKGTTAKILSGKNGSTVVDFDGRNFLKTVDTGWKQSREVWEEKHRGRFEEKSRWEKHDEDDTASNILTLWGMADLGSNRTDVYTLSLTYDPSKARPEHLGRGLFGLATKDSSGKWVNAVAMNQGGTARFVQGPWKPGYDLGTYGVDPSTKTAWAVINYNSDFAVAGFNQ